ncbi:MULTISPECIES: YueI family protein [Bacillaceae]|uniref:YueI family protein n=1 Tax=Evansella alkalicola TaxID=745819 RepID=A0ABS6K0M7_9BACI|nr:MULTISPECIES: YueI family protein [Bacillaceae]MBU9724210.1 YueI family protein [Bacillus alkalicola]
MSKNKLEEIIQHGIYGKPELLPEERKLFLGTISERVYLALTNNQVRKRGIYSEAETVMKQNKDVHMYINGSLSYPSYSNYVQAANKSSVPFTIVNDNRESPLGVVLAASKALDKQGDLFIEDDDFDM